MLHVLIRMTGRKIKYNGMEVEEPRYLMKAFSEGSLVGLALKNGLPVVHAIQPLLMGGIFADHLLLSIPINLMAPLKVTDFGAFHYELLLARDMGAEAITVDVWWGDVEGVADNQFDWSYYDTIFSMIRNAGLKIKPIMSFHQAGGNVGDTYYSFLPAWLWTQYAGQYFSSRE